MGGKEESKNITEIAKKKFMEANSHKDFSANSKQFINTGRFTQDRPVVDN